MLGKGAAKLKCPDFYPNRASELQKKARISYPGLIASERVLLTQPLIGGHTVVPDSNGLELTVFVLELA